jgi:hypothetical protein
MSSSNFFRLYREIDRSLPSKKIDDHCYEKERKEILAQFGEYQSILKTPARVQAPKYHGKVVRKLNNGFDNERRKLREKNEKEFQQRKELRRVMNESAELNIVIHELCGVAEKKEPIPLLLLRKMDFMDKKEKVLSSSSSPSTASHLPLSPSMKRQQQLLSLEEEYENKRKQRQLSLPFSTVGQAEQNSSGVEEISVHTSLLPRIRRNSSIYAQPTQNYNNQNRVFDRSYSQFKWSIEEREKLFTIFEGLPPPPMQTVHISLWQAYFNEFAKRFQVFYPQRSKEDIIAKIHQMILKKQMKNKEETEFWNNLRGMKDSERMDSLRRENSKNLVNNPNLVL